MKIAHRILLGLGFSLVIISGSCLPGKNNDQTEDLEKQNEDIEVEVSPGSFEAEQEINSEEKTEQAADSQNSGLSEDEILFKIDDVNIIIPQDWFKTRVTLENLDAKVFVNKTPENAQLNDDNIFNDFASGAVILSPIPADTTNQDLSRGLYENVSSYGDEEFSAMILVLDQIGLIDMSGIETVRLNEAAVAELGGNEALYMRGEITFLGKDLQDAYVRLWLTWQDEQYISYYQLVMGENTAYHNLLLEETRKSIVLP
ncbi:MAG: hypothetical protein JEZ06_22980 [Anaerolineaceae bacterium]|nr:hypothetical protein [Anaerolineaceae bacterium]